MARACILKTKGAPQKFQYYIEIRNPNYLKEQYFDFLTKQKLGHVFLQGYYMPSIFEVHENFKKKLVCPVVIRLHGGDRMEIEAETKEQWNGIVAPENEDVRKVVNMAGEHRERIC